MFFRHRKSKRVHIKSARNDIVRLVREISLSAMREPNEKEEIVYKHLLLLDKVNNLARSVLEPEEPVYLASSLFLKESFNLLNQREVESMHFVTGPEIDGVKLLDHIVNFTLEKQSVVYAKADSKDMASALVNLAQCEHRLWGYFHIHPGMGACSTLPSGTDLALDRLLDKGGYKAIGAVFSRDGFIRFFSSRSFKIQLYGKGVEKVNERLYHFANIS